jgi:hypothetical protein
LLALGRVRVWNDREEEADASFAAARAVLEPLIERFAGVASYHSLLGQVYAEQGDIAWRRGDEEAAGNLWTKAAAELSRAVQLSPESANDERILNDVKLKRGV